MKKIRGFFRMGILFVVGCGIFTSTTHAATIQVCTNGCPYSVIQSGINAATGGDIIQIGTGVYTTSSTVNKRLTIQGMGNGTNPMTDTIIRVTNAAGFSLTRSGTTINTLRIEPIATNPSGAPGIQINGGQTLQFITINDVIINGSDPINSLNEWGIRILATAKISDLTLNNVNFSNLSYGISAGGATNSYLQNVTITNSTFSNNARKGLEIQKLSNATFTNIVVSNNGQNTSHVTSIDNAGIDINLLTGGSNITFINPTITNNGLTMANGVGLSIKAFQNGSTLNNVSINGGTISGNERGVVIGQAGSGNTSPTAVTFTGVSIFANTGTYVNGNFMNNTVAGDTATHNRRGTCSQPAITAGIVQGGGVTFSPYYVDAAKTMLWNTIMAGSITSHTGAETAPNIAQITYSMQDSNCGTAPVGGTVTLGTGGIYTGVASGNLNLNPLATGWNGTSTFPGLIAGTYYYQINYVAIDGSTLTANGSFIISGNVLDSIPDSFSFTPVTNAALSTSYSSNTITVAGINTTTAISIVGGEYSVDGSPFTAIAGTVGLGNIVQVRQTSSPANSTTTTATLTIGGVQGNFDVTTLVANNNNNGGGNGGGGGGGGGGSITTRDVCPNGDFSQSYYDNSCGTQGSLGNDLPLTQPVNQTTLLDKVDSMINSFDFVKDQCTTLFPEYETITFTDIVGNPYESHIKALLSYCAVRGVGNNLFGVDQNVTRAQLIKILVNTILITNGKQVLQDSSSTTPNVLKYTDVKSTDWYVPYMVQAFQRGLLKDLESTSTNGLSIKPNQLLTAPEAIKVITAAAQFIGRPDVQVTFTEKGTILRPKLVEAIVRVFGLQGDQNFLLANSNNLKFLKAIQKYISTKPEAEQLAFIQKVYNLFNSVDASFLAKYKIDKASFLKALEEILE